MAFGSNRFALATDEDLTIPTSTQKYPLGFIYSIDQGNGSGGSTSIKRYMYVKSHGALTAYVPYVITTGSTEATAVITAAPTTSTTVHNLVGVPQVAFTSGYFGFVQIEGKATAALAATTYTIGDNLELISAAATLNPNATSGSTAYDASSVAICLSVGTAGGNASVILVGRAVSVAAT